MIRHIVMWNVRGATRDEKLANIEQLGNDVESEKLFAIVAAMRARRKALLLPRQNEVLLECNDFHALKIRTSESGH